MRSIRWSFNFVVFGFCFLLLRADGIAAAKGAPAAAKAKAETVKVTTQPFPFLKFEQLGMLERTQRVRYVKALRQAMNDIEKFQFMFRDPLFAQIEQMPNSKDLYALLRGDFAAADDQKDGGRGRYPSDRCIYAYGLSNYPKSGVRQPFMCERPNNCTGENGAGVQCNYTLSGIPSNVKKGCIQRSLIYRATSECDVVRETLSQGHEKEFKEKVDEIEKYYKFSSEGQAKQKITKEELEGAKAQAHLKYLADNAYDDEVYAELIKILSLYKKYGVAIPIQGLGEHYAALDASTFENAFNATQTAVNQIFSKYRAHCETPLDPKEIQILKSTKWKDEIEKRKAMQSGNNDILNAELRRIYAARELDKAQGDSRKALTIENILEVDECKAVHEREGKIKNLIRRAADSYPDISDAPVVAPAPPPFPEPPPKPKEDPYGVTAVGCARNITESEHQLYQWSARCVACIAEKSVSQAAEELENNEGDQNALKYYNVSTKWLSLLSTVALACGNGNTDNKFVSVEAMLDYVQTFGHCDSNFYEWSPRGLDLETYTNDKGKEVDPKKLIEKWSKKSYWMNPDPPGKDEDADDAFKQTDRDFKHVYGISYSDATRLFCENGAFERNKRGDIIKPNADYFKPRTAKGLDMNARRAQFKNYLNTDNRYHLEAENKDSEGRPVASSLLMCMHKSADLADKLYSPGSKQCVATASLADRDKVKKAVSEIKDDGNANLVFDPGTCFVSKQVERFNPSNVYVGFVDTRKQAKNPYLRMSVAGDAKMPDRSIKTTDNPTVDGATPQNQAIGYMSITYHSADACNGHPRGDSSGSGSTK